MKKFLLTALTITALSLFLVSCKSEPAEGFIRVESETCNFSFECPDSWIITRTDGMLAAINPDDISRANVTGYSYNHGIEEQEVSADMCWEDYQAQFEGTFSTMNITKNVETTISGIIARHVFYTVDLGLDSFNCQTVICAFNGKAYTLTLTQGKKTEENAEYYNDHTDEFEEIVKTFRIGG